jgi:hypothetical protein
MSSRFHGTAVSRSKFFRKRRCRLRGFGRVRRLGIRAGLCFRCSVLFRKCGGCRCGLRIVVGVALVFGWKGKCGSLATPQNVGRINRAALPSFVRTGGKARDWGKSKKLAGSQRYEGKVRGAGRRPAVPKTGKTAGEKNSVAGCAEYFRLLLRAAWGTGRNACATGRQMRGASKRSRLEASATREKSKAPARRRRYVKHLRFEWAHSVAAARA